ncbi:MAG: calcium-binding protein [Magnetococcales bacterium]|nr:calcium-binding protein [Magnetococcales bacterium]
MSLHYSPTGPAPAGFRKIESLSVDSSNDRSTGLQVSTYYNQQTRQVVIAVAGTNGLEDATGYPSLYIGYGANQGQINLALEKLSSIRAFANRNDASTLIAGHSFGGAFVDIGAATFGFKGVKIDGVGGSAIVNDFQYINALKRYGITPVSGGDVISVGVSGFLGQGVSLVEYMGLDIPDTTYCHVVTERSMDATWLNVIASFGFGVPGFVAASAFSAWYVHNADSINAGLQSGNFTCAWDESNNAPENIVLSTDLFNLDRQMDTLYGQRMLTEATWNAYTDWSTNGLLSSTLTVTNSFSSITPIGAFYENRRPSLTPAASIARRTFRILNISGDALSSTDLASYDVNKDNKLSGSEINNLYAWCDLNEDGALTWSATTTNEWFSLKAALDYVNLSSVRSRDYGLYTVGNGRYLTAPIQYQTPPIMPVALLPGNPVLANQNNYMLGVGADTFIGTAGADNIWGDMHDDILAGKAGNDRIYGQHHDDYIFGNEGEDLLDGGDGLDVMNGQAGSDIMMGGDGNDALYGDIMDSIRYSSILSRFGSPGLDGHDQMDGGSGHDTMVGSFGNDIMHGGDGNDTIIGLNVKGDFNQVLAYWETDNDVLFGGTGCDELFAGPGDDILDGGNDRDVMHGGSGWDHLFGGSGWLVVNGKVEGDELYAGSGNDVLDGGADLDKMAGCDGDDQMWGGAGDDEMLGFTPPNDPMQTLPVGGTDNDMMYGGEGNDVMIGQFGNDIIYGGDGDDRLYGGHGNSNQTMAANEIDNDFMYGGAGMDTLMGGSGDDYMDGGAGTDVMAGQQGNDIYIVNSVNDQILEENGAGRDQVISSVNYILSAHIEELRLVEGRTIHGTGNRLNNTITGNDQDNILDGVTGADRMIGGEGDDTFYVDNSGDRVVEAPYEGTDVVCSTISYQLGSYLENLTLLDFSKPEKGRVDGVDVLVYGYPKAFELDYSQGDAVAGFKGTCGLTSLANLTTQVGSPWSEADMVHLAINNRVGLYSENLADTERGGTSAEDRQNLMTTLGIRNDIIQGYNEQAIANLIRGGRAVIIGVNAGKLWEDVAMDQTRINHVVTVTGVVYDTTSTQILGCYIADSGRGLVQDMTRYVPIDQFRACASLPGAHAIYTMEPVKLWNEDLHATGNSLGNRMVGNRGSNVLNGRSGNDLLIGQAGNDQYVFARGDDRDTIKDWDSTQGNVDLLRFTNVNQTNLWFSRRNDEDTYGDDLLIQVMGTTDSILIENWFQSATTTRPIRRDYQIERIQTADGMTLYNTDVERLVQAMATFGIPSATQTSWIPGQTSSAGKTLLTVTH